MKDFILTVDPLWAAIATFLAVVAATLVFVYVIPALLASYYARQTGDRPQQQPAQRDNERPQQRPAQRDNDPALMQPTPTHLHNRIKNNRFN